MKKILCFALAAVFCCSLASCKFSDPVDLDTTNEIREETTAPETSEPSDKNYVDYDKDGNFILKSSDDRVVYKLDGGYVVFVFAGNVVGKIHNVIEFENEDAMTEYLRENVTSLMSSGVYNNVNTSKNLIILTYNAGESGMGKYYSYTKNEVLDEFSAEVTN